jgi:NADPH-dependent 2,4-dienoyl-CoA reductase/sulfur reductase-like enzyme
MKVIIIGGDAAGMSAASKLRRVQKNCDIIIYEKDTYLSYAACGLPYFVTSPAIEKDDLIQRTKEEFEKAGLKPFLHHEVLRVWPDQKKMLVKDLSSGHEFEDTYDKLLIATGARPIVPNFPGVTLDGVHVLKTVDDGVNMKAKLSDPNVQNIIVVGGGYIGVEVAESVAQMGKQVRIIEMAERILMPFDPEISKFAQYELARLGVKVNVKERLESIIGDSTVEKVVTDRDTYDADLVILALGVKPATEFLKDSGIQLAGNGAVIIDREMRTNIEDIYAVGDCAQVYNWVKQENDYIPLATTANKCGRITGENLAGKHIKFVGTLGSSALKVGEIELARTGLSESDAQKLELDYKTVLVETRNVPHYYPDSTPIWFKMIYENGTKRILGAQGAGKDVVLRINVFASAIFNKMSASYLGMLDLCYSPPFATVWDAVHITANAAK